MAINLVDMLAKAIPPDLAASLGKAVGASESSVASAIGSFLPMLVGGMAAKAATPDGAGGLFAMLTGSSVDSGIAGTIGGLLGSGQTSALGQVGSALLGSLFGGNRVDALADALGSASGMDGASAKNFAFMLAPLAFGVLKKFIGNSSLNAGGVASLLRDQVPHLAGKLDPTLAAAVGLPAAFATTLTSAVGQGGAAVATAAGAGGAGLMKFLPWLIGGVAAVLLATQLGMCSTKPTAAPVAVAKPAPAVAAAPAPAPAPALAPAPAPAPAAPAVAVAAVLPVKVFFDTGKSDFGAQGAESIGKAVAWLKSDAARQVAITGHTDKSGDTASNEKLAKARAVAVSAALQAAGIAKERIVMKAPLFVEVGATTAAEARRVEISAI